MNYRLVALDLDGTLLGSDLRIREETIETLNEVRARGVEAVLVTGRHHANVYPYWRELSLDTPAICCNGAYLYDFAAQKPLAGDPLSRDEARQLLALCRHHAVDTMIYAGEFMAYERESPYYAAILDWARRLPPEVRPRMEKIDSFGRLIDTEDILWKFFITGANLPGMRALAAEAEEKLAVSCEWSGESKLDIARAGNSKATRLAEWIAGRGIGPEEVIAFGDERNDMAMLRLAGRGVAMGNASEAVRACADWVAGNNDSPAIAETLRRFVLA